MTSSSSLRALDEVGDAGSTTSPPLAASSRCFCGSPVRKRRPAQSSQSMMPSGVEVDAPVADLLPRDLGRDVPGLREDDARDRVASAVLSARGAEVDELHLARVADHHVLRRKVAVDDAERRPVGARALVDVGERVAPSRCAIATASAQPMRAPIWMARVADVGEAAPLDVLDDACRARRSRRSRPRAPGRRPGG